MNSATLRLVLLVSCAHALVHVYELSLPSLELLIGAEYAPDVDPADVARVSKQRMGLLANTWRLPFGFGALLAGWLVARFGARPMLILYLAGCSAMCLAAGLRVSFATLFGVMFLMGAFASIYHPAGLTLISCETPAASRARALGLHGIFGSAGIAAAPFLVGLLRWFGADWRTCYWWLALPSAALAMTLFRHWGRAKAPLSPAIPATSPAPASAKAENKGAAPPKPIALDPDRAEWRSFSVLMVVTVLQGLVYTGVLCFLTRYLSSSPLVSQLVSADGGSSEHVATANMISAFVLAMGCLGQYSAGRFARLERLERQLLQVTAANVPLLLWMSLATGNQRVWAAATFSTVHFMHQPLYNSLIALYTPVRLRSSCYGFSFAMSFGLGSFGAALVGYSANDQQAYQWLASLAAVSTLVAVLLWRVAPSRAAV
ncbi:MAG: MFS transporter [Planctomycetales bacterium]|nr:MFS transporter [Planctomycetales bacterium]